MRESRACGSQARANASIVVTAIDRDVLENGVLTGGLAACMPRNRAPERTRATGRDRSCCQHRRF
ncbi:hypothetical protein XAC3810_800003 [Xanthomonas citri pv. citri]|uniref:Uncharacterized protein n=1 Tax=Xanthomonas citri pv. citri TaxID=611301 RepID=A0A0U5GGL0_XANCI|nr:hypothetical protein XAC902_1110003 [Xanthomonas citri pv. citri]CEJ48760.1 hypothetical protein XAB3213_4370003 [Xanthomonas citri pv. bilvae]CEE24441.1 hypothetical protein XAC908_1130003 [Xanthomonas citri pv. citri]CEE41504.1 hypothetical protein XAC3824_950003 [Xanthomonas citri pv. citri]CEE41600.1 hypothetical protein XAC9322_770003 [Xanthomonas citri pv. citri]